MTDYQKIARWLAESTDAVAFTGAGISTESGVPDFRSPGGVWSKFQPVYYQDFLSSAAARHEYWRQKAIAHHEFVAAQPNPAHQILARWESRDLLRGVITQNIDGLHQQAGSRNLLELHGTARHIACLNCNARQPADPLVAAFEQTGGVPACPECGSGLMKHATISFGQQLPAEVLQESTAWARACSLMFALGSSLVVHPAAGIPELAKQAGARLVIINRDPTPLDEMADVVLRSSLSEALSGIDKLLDP
ncbi:MAG: NAD-dependent protein deacylase [Planctomycetales bacterium]|nr:NAD-dependent protein deacylase [Planctomycetales bacterium]NIM09534.1 NAD-dependent protein deacylase [Planctomycetales bacterium]NIN07371.1 NAD-dependent protein deacylase [Planctomycetales bacterium]NIN76475.1 NAD-dependent protein deacylase [Planctomycetales bacterium]NIO35322.1 NAD-dependent protein deacylase [Planctomycetales bacterium]